MNKEPLRVKKDGPAIWRVACPALAAALVLSAAQPAAAQPGWVLSHQKISNTEGGFTGILDSFDRFGSSVVTLGDLDRDGVRDLAIGAVGDDDGGNSRGAVWVLFLDGVPGCPGDLDGDGDTDLADLGILLADFGCVPPGPCPGDLDGDGDTDLADLGILLADFGCSP